MTICVNLFSGPGAGKSTTATGVFSLLKMHNVNAEYISEYAKDLAWEETLGVYYNQIKILGEQHNRQYRCVNKTDVIITDSPILQQAVYVEDSWYYDVCEHLFNQFDNRNYFIVRDKPYNPMGRKHTEESAKDIDVKLRKLLFKHNYDFTTVKGNYLGINTITNDILTELDITHEIGLGELTEDLQ